MSDQVRAEAESKPMAPSAGQQQLLHPHSLAVLPPGEDLECSEGLGAACQHLLLFLHTDRGGRGEEGGQGRGGGGQRGIRGR